VVPLTGARLLRHVAVTNHRAPGDGVEAADDMVARSVLTCSPAFGRPLNIRTANIRRTTSGLFRDFLRLFLHFGAFSF
jgi:hypothetical protein